MRPAPATSETLTRTGLPGRRPAALASPPLPAGATLGRYVVTRVLGEGGMGVVYAAHDFVLDRRVAVKLVRPDLDPSEREARKARLVSEAQAVGRLNHPNVISVYDVGEFSGELYIAMELVEGQTLRQWLRAGPRPLEEILEVFRQAGRGLAAAHRAGLIHRDFKPHNVLVGADGRVRVTDFGLAVPQEAAAGDGAGTPAYMAPEQVSGQGGPRADQYSFAVTLHEAVLGARPGEPGGDARAPRWLQRVLSRALLPAERRFPSMEELLAALEPAPRSPARSSWLAAGALGVGLAAGAAMAAAVLTLGPAGSSRLPAAAERPELARGAQRPASAGARPGPRARLDRAAPAPPGSSRDGAEAAPVAARISADPAARFSPPLAETWTAPAPGAPAAERREPSLRAALERLFRTLRDLGLLDASPPQAPALAGVPRGGQDRPPEGGGGSVWVPVSWTVRPGSAPSFSAPPGPARVGDPGGGGRGFDNALELAEARFALAQALWDSDRDRERALRLAQQAQAALLAGQGASPELLNQITEWIELRQLYQR